MADPTKHTGDSGGAEPAGARTPAAPSNFIDDIIADHARTGRFANADGSPRVHTRFPPEPNGYLHVGHAKSICLNFGLAKKYNGKFNLRFDDTNPAKEEQEYVDAIKRDVAWIVSAFDAGSFDHGPHAGGLFFASDYFEQMYAWTVELIKKNKAYVCDLSGDEISARRGKPGVPATSPHRDRPAAESLRLLEEMRDGKHPTGSKTVRARIDLASPNFNLRDPVMYRVLHEHHHNTGSKWCIYPMYDWAHGLEDSLEGITHSICTLEFEDHRPLYDWFIDAINEGRTADGSGPWGKLIAHSQQIEFAKFRPTHTIMSKRNLLKMVQEKTVLGWDDPRMPTIAGLRRRGFTPHAIRALCEEIGVTKVESWIDVGRLEGAVREHLNKVAPRAMAVLRPLKVVITNWPEGKADELDFVINPEDPAAGKRKVPFGREIYIEREDFMETPASGFFRLSPGAEVRLRWAYFITCTGVVKDASGQLVEVHATYDPATRGGDSPLGADGKPIKKVKGTLHWVSAAHAIPAAVRLIDRLFKVEEPGKATGNPLDDLNPDALQIVQALVEGHLATAKVGDRFQFERLGYFCVDQDTQVGTPGGLVFNRTVTLKDSSKDAGPSADAKPKGMGITYTLKAAALELRLKQELVEAALPAAGLTDFATRNPPLLTLQEVRGLREWFKQNRAPKA